MTKGHKHDDHEVATPDGRYLAIALGLICCLMVGEVIAAALSGSLALFADAGHLLTDVGGLAASLWAARLAARPAKGIWTFGLKRAEILSAAVNGLSLAAIAVVIGVEAIMRLFHPTAVDGLVVLVVALSGVVVDLAATLVLARASRTSLNIRGAFVHMVTDLYAFAGTAVAGLVIIVTGFRRADALASLVVVALMAKAAWCLLRDSGRILLQGAPDRLDLSAVRSHLLEVEHVVGVHDLHAWTVTSGLPSLSAHVVVDDSCFATGHAPQILDQLQSCVGAHFEVEHATFQLEPAAHSGHEPGTHG